MVKFDYDKTYRKGRLITDETTLKFIRNHFSVKDKNAAFVNRKSFGRKIPDRKYAVQATGLFDFGLHQEIRKFLIDKQINDIQFTDSFNNHLKVGYDVQDLFDGLKYELRDYQRESVEESLRIGSGTNVLATSAGKSLIQAALIENISRINPEFKCILIVPGLSLVNQLVQDFKDLKKHLKQQSKSQLIQNIVNLIHNQLTLIDTVQALQARRPKEESTKESSNV